METVDQHQTNPIARLFSDITTKKAILTISILGIIVFGNSLGNGFAGDDGPNLLNYQQINQLSNIGNFFTGKISVNTNYYKPIFTTVNAVLAIISGLSPVVFHVFSLIVYLVSVILLFLVLSEFFSRQLALILALIFLVHPLNSEVVFYISNIQDLLYFFFGILGIYKLIKAKSTGGIVLVTVLLFLSILSKETGALFFLIALLYSLIYKRTLLYRLLGLFGFAGLIYLSLRMNAIGIYNTPLNTPIADLDFWNRAIHIPAVLFFYIKTFFFPAQLSVSYYWVINVPNIINFYLPIFVDALVILSIVLYGVRLYKKNNQRIFSNYLFFGFWLIVGLLLHLQLIPLDATVADRWFYFPMVGALGIMGVTALSNNINLNNSWVLLGIIIVIFILSARTFIRSFDWRNELTLATHDAMVSESHALEITIANNLIKQGKLEEAKDHAQKAVNIYPNFTSYNTLGLAYANLHEYELAITAFEKSVALGAYQPEYENLSFTYLMANDLVKAENFTDLALDKYPDSVRLWHSLAIIEYKLGKIDKAKMAVANAYQLEPSQQIKILYDAIMSGKSELEFNVAP